ncbi:site-specific integrase [Pseudomonas fluorescens]|uniref:Uncharacterized protein n=1 Tax=Pseudomonas fluorescens TaxID=294 RepID=A0A5E7CA70_PSEFL|nr:site-specific integrase [Pseudomonas fluorescens]VVO01723.1 hypothetical protein PS691_02684 [Pseudomonas fluorescens]
MSNRIEPQYYVINQLGSDFFYVIDAKSEAPRKINFKWECSIEKRVWAQNALLLSSNFLSSSRAGPMEVRSCHASVVESVLLKKLCEYWEKNHSTKPLWNWNRSEVKEMVRKVMVRDLSPLGDPILYAANNLNQFCYWLSISHEAYLDGRINDGISFKTSSHFKKEVMDPLMKFLDSDYAEWVYGGSYGSISPAIASLLLAHSIQILESESLIAAQCFFKAWKKNPTGLGSIFRQFNRRNLDVLERDHFQNSARSVKSLKLKHALLDEFKESGILPLSRLPWDSYIELSDFCRLAIQACMVIILTLTGHRAGELLSVHSADWEVKGDEVIVREEIEKTLNGLRIPRYFHSLAARAVKTIWSLSFIDSEKHRIPLHHKAWSSGLASAVINGEDVDTWLNLNGELTANTLRQWLDNYFEQSFLVVYPEVKAEHPGISPHQFRHSWAEFSIRRFDHNVEAQVREYFLHKSKKATRRYTDKKLSESVQYSIEHEYLDEVIHQVISDRFGDEYRGPAYRRIVNTLSKVDSLDPAELDALVESICNSVESYTAFEWGCCLLLKNSKQDAKCHDSFTGLPAPKIYASVKRCTTCPNLGTNALQRNNLTRIAINHSYIAKHHSVLAIAKLSQNVVDQISRLLD